MILYDSTTMADRRSECLTTLETLRTSELMISLDLRIRIIDQ